MTDSPCSNERTLSLDTIFNNNIKLYQYVDGYRFNADSLILSWFVAIFSSFDRHAKVIEIGSGTGIVPIVLKQRGFTPSITCFEIQDDMFELLKKNIMLNNLSHSLFPVADDFLSYSFQQEQYDCVFTNPPYFSVGSGRLSPTSQKAQSKYECFGSLSDFLKKTSYILRKRASLYIIYPVSKLQICLSAASDYNLHAKEIVLFREFDDSSPSLFCVRFIKSSCQTTISTCETVTMKEDVKEYTATGHAIMFSL